MKQITAVCFSLILLQFISTQLMAATLATSAKIVSISNISSGINGFVLKVKGGDEFCANGEGIMFLPALQPDQSIEALNRAFALATLAFSMDLLVEIYSASSNTNSNECTAATTLVIKRGT